MSTRAISMTSDSSIVRGVGIDIVEVERFRRLLATAGTRFAARWFTDAERADCDAACDPAAAYAERFALKEAALKSMPVAPQNASVPWLTIATAPRVQEGTWSVSIGCSLTAHPMEIYGIAALSGPFAAAVAIAFGDSRS